MGLWQILKDTASGVMSDQWREYFYCDTIPETTLAVRGQKRTTGRSVNTKSVDNIISNGSIIAVADGQCMLIVEQGMVVEVCAQPGEFVYDSSTEPSILGGGLRDIPRVFATIGKRFTFGGEPPKEQRVYYFNTKEIMGNRYGTPNPVPFKVVDEDIGFKLTIGLRCFGEFSYRICNPLLFYTNVCGNFTEAYQAAALGDQLLTELLTALPAAFGQLYRIDYGQLPMHSLEIANALNNVLSGSWREQRGIEVAAFGISSIKATEEDEEQLRQMQVASFIGRGDAASGVMTNAAAQAMQNAAGNPNGAMMGFMGMNMAQGTGMNAMGMFGQPPASPGAAPAPQPQGGVDGGWTCPSCGIPVSGMFCSQCGMKKPEPKPQPVVDQWVCPNCGNTVGGMFCAQCGTKKPEPQPELSANGWVCPNCGTSVEGNFCPKCGTKKPEPKPTGWTCPQCGASVEGNFCPKCGMKKPAAQPEGWTCPQCGRVNKEGFCPNCGARKPAGVPKYRCDKCGWEPPDPTQPPRFCPQCGDPFNDGDIV